MVVLFLVRVFPQYAGGRAGFIIMPLLLYHPRDVTMLTAAAPSYNSTLDPERQTGGMNGTTDATERTVAWKIFVVEKILWVDETTKFLNEYFKRRN